MRLWTQARLMGTWAAQVMAGVDGDSGLSFAFELVGAPAGVAGEGGQGGGVQPSSSAPC